jgi:hypothetical protein
MRETVALVDRLKQAVRYEEVPAGGAAQTARRLNVDSLDSADAHDARSSIPASCCEPLT